MPFLFLLYHLWPLFTAIWTRMVYFAAVYFFAGNYVLRVDKQESVLWYFMTVRCVKWILSYITEINKW